MLNFRIKATSVFGHRSSNQISKGSKVTGFIADNHIRKYFQLDYCHKFLFRRTYFFHVH